MERENEREKMERERERFMRHTSMRERHIDWLPPVSTQRIETAAQACALDLESNLRSFCVWADAPTTEPLAKAQLVFKTLIMQ